ncbi:MAG: hypothetical protein KatS3mg105_5060 [Gemmatales bacterium]|nr:MAG: hypothetical protein KatS3mg105_5060 [Gemmatales bacterium]
MTDECSIESTLCMIDIAERRGRPHNWRFGSSIARSGRSASERSFASKRELHSVLRGPTIGGRPSMNWSRVVRGRAFITLIFRRVNPQRTSNLPSGGPAASGGKAVIFA